MLDTFELDTLADLPVDPSIVREANAFRTLPTGAYDVTCDKIDLQVASEKSPWPGRKMFRLQVSATQRVQNSDNPRKGKIFFDVSHDVRRNDTGKLDAASRLWGQAVKTFGMEDKTVLEVVDAIQKYPFGMFVTEAFKKPEGGYLYPRSDSERTDAEKSGATPVNFVQSISKAR